MTTPPPSPPHKPERGKDAAVFCMIAIASIFVASIIGWQWAGSGRADLAQWLAGFAATATLTAAIIAAVFAAGAFRLETEREERYRSDQRRHQAERFAAWYDTVEKEIKRYDGTVIRRSRVIRARNASDLPVTSVTFILLHEGEQITTHWVATVPPSNDPVDIHLSSDTLDAIDQMNEFLRDEQEGDYDHTLDVDLSFKDAAGRRWLRMHDGDLQQIEDDDE